MRHIRAYQQRLHELNGMPIRGSNDQIQDYSKQSYIKKIPTQEFEYFENKCLPLTIILGSIVEKGLFLKDKEYATRANTLMSINSKNPELRKKACKRLKKEIENVLKKLPNFREIQDYTLENTCLTLAIFFEVNIVVHELKYGKDFIDQIQSPTKREYDPIYPRVDILVSRNGDFYSGHADLISPRFLLKYYIYSYSCFVFSLL